MFVLRQRYDALMRERDELLKKNGALEQGFADAQDRYLGLERSAARTNAHFAAMTARAHEADKRAEIAQNNFEWARLGINRAEQERSLLLSHLLKFPVNAMEIARQTPMAEAGDGIPNQPNRGLYDDIGDDEAARLGIEHDAEGRVIYKEK